MWTFGARQRWSEHEKQAQEVGRQASRLLQTNEDSQPEHSAVVRDVKDVTKDEFGRVLSVTHATPQGVLRGYCEASSLCASREPLFLAPTVPANHKAWLGLFRESSAPTSTVAFPINKNSRTGRWVAGDGKRPVAYVAAGKVRSGDSRVRVAP